jgi:prophage regulatory protein
MSEPIPVDSLGLPPLCRVADLSPAIRMSRSQIWSLTAQGRFPKPVKISTRCTAWRRADVERWLAAKVLESGGQP